MPDRYSPIALLPPNESSTPKETQQPSSLVLARSGSSPSHPNGTHVKRHISSTMMHSPPERCGFAASQERFKQGQTDQLDDALSPPSVESVCAFQVQTQLHACVKYASTPVALFSKPFQAGTFRTPDGGLTEDAGRLEVLDAVLASCSSAADPLAELQKIGLAETIAKAGFAEGSDAAASAGHYARAAQKLADKGKGYLATELKRLEGMMDGGAATISPQKRTLFMVRSNILRAFVEAGFGEKGADGKRAEL